MADEAITLKQLRDFTKRTAGDARIYVEDINQIQSDVVSVKLVKTMDGIRVILEVV